MYYVKITSSDMHYVRAVYYVKTIYYVKTFIL